MAECKLIKRKHRKICVGDMDTAIKVQDRDIQPPPFGSADFDEDFSVVVDRWAYLETLNGESVFDSTNTERTVSHILGIAFDPAITAENWVQLASGKRLDIVLVENLEERDEFLFLMCEATGTSKAAQT